MTSGKIDNYPGSCDSGVYSLGVHYVELLEIDKSWSIFQLSFK